MKKIVNTIILDTVKIEKEKHIYQIFGVITVFDKYKTLLSEEEKRLIKTWKCNFEKGHKNNSIVSNFDSINSTPIFNYFTFAQYFAACYFSDKLISSHLENAEEVFKFYDESLVKDIHIFRRVFLSKIKTFFYENVLQEEHLINFVARQGLLNYAVLLLDHCTFKTFYENDLLYPSFDDDSYFQRSKRRISITVLRNAIKIAKANVGIFIILFVYRRLLNSEDFKETPLYYLSKFISKIDDISDSAIIAFIEDIKLASIQQSLKPKNKMTNFFLGPSEKEEEERNHYGKDKKFSIYKINEIKSNILYSNFSSIHWEIFSYENIKNILIHFGAQNISEDGFFQDICISPLMTDKEKGKLLELFLNDSNFPKECVSYWRKDKYLEKCLSYIIKNDCVELMNQILTNKNIIIDNKILITAFDKACKMNVPEVVKTMLNRINEELLFEYISKALKEPSLNTIKAIFESPRIPINLSSTDKGSTFLHVAIENQCEHKIIDYLLTKGADPNIADKDGKTPWICAIEKADDDIIQLFLTKFDKSLGSKKEVMKEYFKNPNFFDANLIINGKTRLHQAITEKNTELCKFFMRKGANVHLQDASNGRTPISYACENDLYEVVKWLLYFGASYDDGLITVEKIKSKEIQEMLHETEYAFTEMQRKEFRVSDCEGSQYIDALPTSMKKMKYLRNATNKYQQSLWHIAAKSGFYRNLAQFEYDFDFQKTINNQDIFGNTALHYAVKSNKKHSIQILLNMGAYYNMLNKNDETPQALATLDEIKEMFKNIDDVFTTIKASNKKLQYLALEREFGAKIYNIQNREGRTLLHYAVINNNMSVLRQLLVRSYKNDKDIYGFGPLFYAVKEGKYEMMKKLIDRNAVFEPKLYKNLEKNECTKFVHKMERHHFLSCNENVEEIKMELKTFKDNQELNIITRAVYSRDYQTPKIVSKFDPRWGEEMKTIWKYAEINYELMLHLLQNGIAPNEFNVKNLRIKAVIFLLLQIQKYIKEIDQDSVIKYCEGYVTDRILYFLNPNGKINCTRKDIDRIFASFRIHNRFTDDNAYALLHLAAISNKEKIVKWLIKEKGADPYEKDWKGQDTYDLAKKNESEKVMEILELLEKN